MPCDSLKRHLAIVALLAAMACESAPTTAPSRAAALALETRAAAGSVTKSVFATGLQYPRGIAFGPDGDLYVAEAGTGGTTTTTAAECAQVIAPVGPYATGPTARISRIDRDGARHTFATGFPSGLNQLGDIMGVADVAFEDGRLYALLAGGGCSHGSLHVPASVARVARSGSWAVTANLSAWQAGHPVAHPNLPDFEPDGSWYSMIRANGSLVAVEANHGEIVRVNPHTGMIARIADISATQGHAVPTVVAERRGAFYVSSLGVFPSTPGSQTILRVSRSGEVSVVAEGFTAVLGLDFDRSGRLYVLETSTVAGFPTPGTGRVIRLDGGGHRSVIADSLYFPTSLRIGPDNRIYVSNKGFGPPQPGEILRIDVRDATALDAAADMEPATE
jgi:hypothetical protein